MSKEEYFNIFSDLTSYKLMPAAILVHY